MDGEYQIEPCQNSAFTLFQCCHFSSMCTVKVCTLMDLCCCRARLGEGSTWSSSTLIPAVMMDLTSDSCTPRALLIRELQVGGERKGGRD